MVVNQKVTGRALSMPAGLLAGASVSLVITLLSVMLIAKLVENGYIAVSGIGYGIMTTLMLASFAGALTACGRIKRQRLIVCVLSGVLYLFVLLSITALFFGGQYEAVGVTAILIFGGSALALLTGTGKKRMSSGRRRIVNR